MAVPWHAGMGGGAVGPSTFIPLPKVRRDVPGLNVGSGLATAGEAIKLAVKRPKGNIRGIQQFLRSRGYNVSVDGVYGPQTAGALIDWHTGAENRDPNAWNRRTVKVEDPQRTNSPRNEHNQPVVVRGGRPQKASPVNNKPLNRTAPPVKSGRDNRTVLAAGPMENSPLEMPTLDPESYIDSLMKQKYGPIMAELDRRRQRVESAGTNRVSEIGDMYGTYVNDMVERGGQANAEREAMVKATGGLAGAIGGAIPLGEATAAELTGRGDIETDYAALLDKSAGDFDRRMTDAARAGGIFAAAQARSATAADLEDVEAQQMETLNQRGADVSSARDDLMRWQYEQGMRAQELEAATQSDRIKNQMALMELQAAMRMAPMESKKAQMEITRLMQDINYTRAQTRKTIEETEQIGKPRPEEKEESFPRNFTGLNQVDRDNLAASIAKRIPEGASVAQVTRIVKAALRTIGYNPNNRAVAQFGFNLARAYDSRGSGRTSAKWWGLGK